MAERLQLLVEGGTLAGRRFEVPPGGLRLGRSSSNDINPADLELSRNHCLFEQDGERGLRAIDLASANGTYVNGERLGAEPRVLAAGDVVSAGMTAVRVVEPPGADLGLGGPVSAAPAGRAAAATATATKEEQVPSSAGRATHVLWVVAALFAVATVVLLFAPVSTGSRSEPAGGEAARSDADAGKPRILSFSLERIDADPTHIARYSAELSESGILHVAFEDVPGENRKVERSGKISEWAVGELSRIFAPEDWEPLEPMYCGASASSENALRGRTIRMVSSRSAKEVRVENAAEPKAFRRIREALETLANNELGVQSALRPRDELLRSSAESEAAGDAKWEARDVAPGSIFECIRLYRSAKNDLATLGSGYEASARLQGKISRAEAELARRCDETRFQAERARQIGDWERARAEFRRLCDMVPDRADPRHAEADANMVDVEKRLEASLKQKGGRRK